MELSAIANFDSPVGILTISASERGITALDIAPSGKPRLPFSTSDQAMKHIKLAIEQLKEFFEGGRSVFDLALDISGTSFQQLVWQEIAKLPKGEFASYGELAHRIGKPMAARAIGGAVGSNPVPILIGCHRILGSTKTLTGYSGGGGLLTKKWLLDFEGISYK